MLETAALAAGMSWASGFRLYLAVLAAGLLARFGWMELPNSLDVLSSDWVVGVAAAMALAEFVADKVPGFDTIWDGIHTFIRIPAGAVLAAAAFGNLDPQWMAVAGLVGGTLAGTAHAVKAGTRALINVSPEPFSNWTASFTEDAAATGSLALAFFLPVLFFILLAVALVAAIWLLPKLWRGVRRLHGALTGKTRPPGAR